MSNHDTPQIDFADADTQQPCAAAQAALAMGCASDLGVKAEDGSTEFKISVRKVQAKVQARGVLAE